MQWKRIVVMVLAALLSLGLLAGVAHAWGWNWMKNHPRRVEVNQRLDNQKERIKEGVESGNLTKAQAKELHQEDRDIRTEERIDAAKNGSHITKAEQNKLNKEENAVSKQIHEEKHSDYK